MTVFWDDRIFEFDLFFGGAIGLLPEPQGITIVVHSIGVLMQKLSVHVLSVHVLSVHVIVSWLCLNATTGFCNYFLNLPVQNVKEF